MTIRGIVDFNFRSRFTNTGNYRRALERGTNPVRNLIRSAGELLRGERVGPVVTREAWARVMLPKALEDSIPWALRIVTKRKNGREAVVAYYGITRRAGRLPGAVARFVRGMSQRSSQRWSSIAKAGLDS